MAEISFISFLASPTFPFLHKNLWGWKLAQKQGSNEVLATLTDGTLYIKSATATLNGNTLEVK